MSWLEVVEELHFTRCSILPIRNARTLNLIECVGVEGDRYSTGSRFYSDRPEGRTMLEALQIAGIGIPSSSEVGICLNRKTRYLEGWPIHRDIALPKNQRSEYLTLCVSGSDGGRITLDL